MIKDLDDTMAELLRATLPPSLVQSVAISFATPDGTFPPSSVVLPAIDVFLYDIRENRDLRSNERSIERGQSESLVIRRPPVRVACSYLITAWASTASPKPVEDEHYMIGEVMAALLRYPVLPIELLKGALASQSVPLPVTALQAGSLQSMGEFWQALGGKPKVTLHYTVTIAVDAFKPEDAGPAVKEARVNVVLKPAA